MFKVIEKLGELAKRAAERDAVDPEIFQDPLAMRTEWTPKAGGGSNFTTHRVFDPAKLKNCVPLARIHALQILAERVTSSGSKGRSRTYCSYELNLVLDDGSRLNVVDHGNLDSLRSDAAEIAAFLGKPLWDATMQSQLL